MATITRATLSETLPEFIRDVLRQNITDPAGRYSVGATAYWIFKDDPQDTKESTNLFPRVIISESSSTWGAVTIGNRGHYGSIMLTITVYDEDPYRRDTISDDIRMTLSNPAKADHNSLTMRQNRVRCVEITTGTRDVFTDYPRLLRVKEINAVFKFYGN